MFAFKKKLEFNLKNCMSSKSTKDYRVIIKCKNFQENIVKKIVSYKGEVLSSLKYCNLISARLNSRGIERLLEYPEVEYICFDEYVFLCGMSVPTANKIKLSDKSNITGKGIGISVIDSGVYPHTDLLTPYNKIGSFTDLIDGLNHPYDDNGHGTCTCGIIAGSGERSNKMYCGVAQGSTLYCYKAFDKLGKGFVSDILYALELILLDSEKHNIRVICLPFELLYYNPFIIDSFNTLFKIATDKGIVPVVPSGSNKNIEGSLTGIALCKNCITVSGLDTRSSPRPYTYSSSGIVKNGSKPDLCAACVDIVSLNSNTNYISEKDGIKLYPPKLETSYKTFSGTSLAAAYISGLCALLFESNPSLNFKDIVSLLKVSCEELDLPRNFQGDGTVNINKIIK
ncbi:S8 family serine peptidase [Clostridium sp.]|uniref:S8 family serine peptidase n=1 Tax=Clostridium sp. TaxID=1506 RepID=UPI002FC7B1D9